jgi:hypothetical protein
MNDQPATPARCTKKSAAARSMPRLGRVPIPATDATNDEIFEFACQVGNYDYTQQLGVDAFAWAGELFDRFEDTGELPDERQALLTLPFVFVRLCRFSPSGYDGEMDGGGKKIMQAIMQKLRNQGPAYVDIHK